MKRALLLLLCLSFAVAGCGSSKKETSSVPIGPVLPAAQTPAEWADRVVNIFLRPINTDLNVVTNFNNPQIRLFIASQNPTTLRIIKKDHADEPPDGFDPILSAVDFSFKVACPSEFDCRTEQTCPPEPLVRPEINYLAKDYASFRTLLLEDSETF